MASIGRGDFEKSVGLDLARVHQNTKRWSRLTVWTVPSSILAPWRSIWVRWMRNGKGYHPAATKRSSGQAPRRSVEISTQKSTKKMYFLLPALRCRFKVAHSWLCVCSSTGHGCSGKERFTDNSQKPLTHQGCEARSRPSYGAFRTTPRSGCSLPPPHSGVVDASWVSRSFAAQKIRSDKAPSCQLSIRGSCLR
jgi:hypothetical protein